MTRRPARAPRSPRPSTSAATPRRPRSTSLVALVLVGLLVGLLAAPFALATLGSAASAHDALTGSTPADGSTVPTPPSSIELTFSQPPLGIGAEVQVSGPDGAVVNDGDLVLTDATVSQPLVADLPAGPYTVAWRVTSSDGHPISGELAFTAEAGTATVPDPSPEPSVGAGATEEPAEPTAGPDEEPAQPTDEPTAAVGPGASQDGAEQAAGRSALPWVVVAVALAAAGATAWWVRRRGAGRDRG